MSLCDEECLGIISLCDEEVALADKAVKDKVVMNRIFVNIFMILSQTKRVYLNT